MDVEFGSNSLRARDLRSRLPTVIRCTVSWPCRLAGGARLHPKGNARYAPIFESSSSGPAVVSFVVLWAADLSAGAMPGAAAPGAAATGAAATALGESYLDEVTGLPDRRVVFDLD